MRTLLFQRGSLVAAATCVTLLASCASNQVLRSSTDRLEPGKDAVVLMTLKVSNKVKPTFQQNLAGVVLGGKVYRAPKPIHSVAKDYNEYILSMRVAGGSRTLKSFTVVCGIPIIIQASSSIPMNTTANVEAGHVYYLGQVEADMNPLKEGEQRAAIFPLVDAAVVGYSQGSWGVTIRDNYQQDMALIQSNFPAVQGVKVDKQILPAWKRQ